MLRYTDSQAQRGLRSRLSFTEYNCEVKMIYSTEDFKVTKLSLPQRKKDTKKRKNELLKYFKRVICLPPYDYMKYIPNICQRSRLFLFRFRLLKSKFPKVQGISRAFHSVKYQI